MAERRMYLPLVSFSLLAGALLGRAVDSMRRGRAYAPLALGLLLAAGSVQRSLVWQGEESLWRDTVAKSPAKVRPKLQLARALAGKGPEATAERFDLLQQARGLAPQQAEVALELGVFHLQTGNPAEALAEFDLAAAAEPPSAQIQANRGAALYLLNRTAEAEGAFRLALELDPCNFDARHNLILLHRALGSFDEAQELARLPGNCRWAGGQISAIRGTP
jgi:Flp pilus assembly protein TadD